MSALLPMPRGKAGIFAVSVVISGDAEDSAHTGHMTENADDEREIGGDPACWAHLVCPECGRFAEGNSAETGICAVCGAALPTDDD
jgi:hypothetical protein